MLREVLEKFYAHGQPSPIFLEDLLKVKAGLHVVFEKLLLHALGSIYLKIFTFAKVQSVKSRHQYFRYFWK